MRLESSSLPPHQDKGAFAVLVMYSVISVHPSLTTPEHPKSEQNMVFNHTFSLANIISPSGMI